MNECMKDEGIGSGYEQGLGRHGGPSVMATWNNLDMVSSNKEIDREVIMKL